MRTLHSDPFATARYAAEQPVWTGPRLKRRRKEKEEKKEEKKNPPVRFGFATRFPDGSVSRGFVSSNLEVVRVAQGERGRTISVELKNEGPAGFPALCDVNFLRPPCRGCDLVGGCLECAVFVGELGQYKF